MDEHVVLLAGKRKVLSLDEIKPYELNNKNHSPESIDRLIRAIEKGYDQPITVDAHNVIIKGHRRHMALTKMGVDKVEVLVRDDLGLEECRIARIIDNTIVEDDWSIEAMMAEIEDLNSTGAIGSLLELGLTEDRALDILGEDNLDQLMAQLEDDLSDQIDGIESITPELTKPIPDKLPVENNSEPLIEPKREVVYPNVEDEDDELTLDIANTERVIDDHKTIKPLTLNMTLSQRQVFLRQIKDAQIKLGTNTIVETIERSLEFIIDAD